MNERDAGSVEALDRELFAELVDALQVVVEGGDIKLALCGDGFGKDPIGESDDDGEPGLGWKVGEGSCGSWMFFFSNESFGHIVHASIEFIDGTEDRTIVGFRADAVRIAGVWLEIFEEKFVAKVSRSGFKNGAEFASRAVGDDRFSRVAGFPVEKCFPWREKADGRPDRKCAAGGFLGDGYKLFFSREGVANSDRRDTAIDGIEFVFVLVGTDHKRSGDIRKDDGAGSDSGCNKDSVDKETDFFAVVSSQEMGPVAGFE